MGNMQITNAPTRSQADTLFMVVEHLAERPAPGTPDRLCFVRETGNYFIDHGDIWSAQRPLMTYNTVGDLEANASMFDVFAMCLQTSCIYMAEPIGTYTVDHVSVLSVAGLPFAVWRATLGMYGPSCAGGPESSRPAAANMSGGLYFNLTTGILQWSDGTTWHNASS